MKKTISLLIAAALLSIPKLYAQSAIDKANNKLDNISNTVDKANNFAGKIGGFFKKKKKQGADTSASAAGYQTVITITDIDMPKLKKLNENIKACKGVSATKMKFSNNSSVIYVAHSGSTEDLLNALEKSSKDIFSDKNIKDMEDGKVDLDMSDN